MNAIKIRDKSGFFGNSFLEGTYRETLAGDHLSSPVGVVPVRGVCVRIVGRRWRARMSFACPTTSNGTLSRNDRVQKSGLIANSARHETCLSETSGK